MLLIIHGEDIKKSNEFLQTKLAELKTTGAEITIFSPKEKDLTEIRQLFDSVDLFATNNVYVIQDFFSQKESNFKTKLKEIIKKNTDKIIILYEQDSVNGQSLNSFKNATVHHFKAPDIIFKFTDALVPNNQRMILSLYQKALEQNLAIEYLVYMINRQLNLMIQAKNKPSEIKAAPFVKTKIQNQAKQFSMSDLISLHHQLYLLDKNYKTGETVSDNNHLLTNFLLKI